LALAARPHRGSLRIVVAFMSFRLRTSLNTSADRDLRMTNSDAFDVGPGQGSYAIRKTNGVSHNLCPAWLNQPFTFVIASSGQDEGVHWLRASASEVTPPCRKPHTRCSPMPDWSVSVWSSSFWPRMSSA